MKKHLVAFTLLSAVLCVTCLGAANAAAPQPQRWALIIGVNRYDNESGLRSLPFCVNDAAELAKTLTTRCGFPRDNVLLITDQAELKPTNRVIWNRLRTWLNLPKRGDTILVYFGCHGVLAKVERQERLYLMPSDGSRSNPARFAIPLSHVRERLAVCAASRKILILDACHAGAGRAEDEMSKTGAGEVRGIAGVVAAKSVSAQSGTGVVVLAACDAEQKALEREDVKHGLFSYYLIEGLKGRADTDGDRTIVHSELVGYVTGNVERWAARVGKTQTPIAETRVKGLLPVASVVKGLPPPPVREELMEAELSNVRMQRVLEELENTMAKASRLYARGRYGDSAKEWRKAVTFVNALAPYRDMHKQSEIVLKNLLRAAAADKEAGAIAKEELTEKEKIAAEALFKKRVEESIRQRMQQDAKLYDESAPYSPRQRTAPEVPAWAKVLAEQVAYAQKAGLPAAKVLDLGNGLTMKLVLIPPGEFMMGSPAGESGRKDNEGPQHRVRITKPFYMGATEVTNAQFRRFKPSHVSRTYKGNSFNGDQQPVVYVSWNDATAFCHWLGRQTGQRVRLPSEAQWEYACRAGSGTAYPWGSQISDRQCNYSDKNHPSEASDKTADDGHPVTAPVGNYPSNAFGLHDVIGNVWEWCGDWHDKNYYKSSPADDPMGPRAGTGRVLRGGSWFNPPRYCRSAVRAAHPAVPGHCGIGFRVVMSAWELMK